MLLSLIPVHFRHTGAVQTDIPSFGYVFFCFRYMSEGQVLLYDSDRRMKYWRSLVWFNFGVLFMKVWTLARLMYSCWLLKAKRTFGMVQMTWQLPALLFDWQWLPDWTYTLVNMLALTRGLTLHRMWSEKRHREAPQYVFIFIYIYIC